MQCTNGYFMFVITIPSYIHRTCLYDINISYLYSNICNAYGNVTLDIGTCMSCVLHFYMGKRLLFSPARLGYWS